MPLPKLLTELQTIYTLKIMRKKERMIRLNDTVDISPASLLTADVLESKITRFAIKKLQEQRDVIDKNNYLMEGTSEFRIFKTHRGYLPGQVHDEVSYTVNTITNTCNCGYMNNLLIPCRHLIAVYRRIMDLGMSEYELILKTTHPRWSINVLADIQEQGKMINQYDGFIRQVELAKSGHAEWKNYTTPTNRYNAFVDRAKYIAGIMQHSVELFEYSMGSIVKLAALIESPGMIDSMSQCDTMFFDVSQLNTMALDESSTNDIVSNNNNSNPTLVRNPYKPIQKGKRKRNTNKIKCSGCKAKGHTAASKKCPKRAKYIAKDTIRRKKNEKIRNQQQQYQERNFPATQ